MKLLHLLFVLALVPLFSTEGIKYDSHEISHTFCIQAVHTLEVDPELFTIKPVKALDNGIGRESVLSLSRRYGAIASVNGGFFKIGGTYDGRGSGTLKIHDWYALPIKPRGCIGWSEERMPKFDRLLARISCQYEGSSFEASALNRPRGVGECILYTPCFHRTTLTNNDGQELIVVDGVIQNIQGGSSKIPENGYVLSIQEESPLFNVFEVGMPLDVSIEVFPLLETEDREWEVLKYIVGGTPLLLHGGRKLNDWAVEQTLSTFLTYRHARTAVGLLPNGHWLFVVVDKTGLFDGMTIEELADLMQNFGCIEALNLDGGGSSTLVFEDVVKNLPRGDVDEGGGQIMTRRVSDAIIIVPKQ